MKLFHRLTNVTAIMTIFVVLLLLPSMRMNHSHSVGGFTFATVQASEPENDKKRSWASTLEENLILAYKVGEEVGHPETIQALMLQETNAGRAGLVDNNLPPNKRSFGIMQMQPGTAKAVLNQYPELRDQYFPGYRAITDRSIITLLLTNNEACIRIAAYHYKDLMERARGNWSKAVASYNLGIGGVQRIRDVANFGYVQSVRTKLKSIVRPFNASNEHQLM
jgi:hypothetical protein